MLIRVEVSDALGNESYFEVNAENKSQARNIARNLHILKQIKENKYSKDPKSIPLIFTEIEE